jgi:hypothetical protein
MSENMLRKQWQKYSPAEVILQLYKSPHLLKLIDKGNLGWPYESWILLGSICYAWMRSVETQLERLEIFMPRTFGSHNSPGFVLQLMILQGSLRKIRGQRAVK